MTRCNGETRDKVTLRPRHVNPLLQFTATLLERLGWFMQFTGGFIRVFAKRLGEKGYFAAFGELIEVVSHSEGAQP